MKMSLGTINAILNTAPVIIQGASKLITMIKNRGNPEQGTAEDVIPETLEGLKSEVNRIHQRLDASDNSDVEQIKLIEELARQNESLAETLKRTVKSLNQVTFISIVALAIAITSLVLLFLA